MSTEVAPDAPARGVLVRPEAPAQPEPAGRAPAEQAPVARPEPSAQPESGNGWVVPLCVLIIGSFMSVLDTSIVNIAIPTMQTALSASADDIEWVVTGYTLVLGVVVPLTGWLGLRLGQTRLYLLALVGFALASALCGFAWNLDSMIAFRVLQAIPGGVLPVVTLTLLYRIVPPDRRGTAMGLYGLGVVVAPAIGPTLGGYLVEYIDWRLIFYINVPIGIAGAVLAVMVFPQIRPTTWPRLDVWGFVTIAYALIAVLLAFSEGEDWGWTGYRILGLFVTAALSFGLFLVIENEVDDPLIDLRVFRFRAFYLSLALIAVAMTGLFSALYFLPQYLQQVQGLQELDSGLVLLPAALVLTVLMPVAGRLYDAVGPRYPVMAGLAIMAWGSFLLAGITPDTPDGDIELWLGVRNVGVGLCMMPIITSGTSALPPTLTSAGSSVNNVVQRLASSVAIAVFGSVNTTAAAQLTADRGALTEADPYAVAQIQGGVPASGSEPTSGLIGLYQSLEKSVTTQTYANGFHVVGILSAAGILLALFMRSGKQGGGERGAVEL